MSLELISILIGAGMPTVIAVINQPSWPAWARAVATLLVCAVVGGITAAVQGDLTGKRWTEAAALIFAAALGTYHAWWKRSGITDAIEKATVLPTKAAAK